MITQMSRLFHYAQPWRINLVGLWLLEMLVFVLIH